MNFTKTTLSLCVGVLVFFLKITNCYPDSTDKPIKQFQYAENQANNNQQDSGNRKYPITVSPPHIERVSMWVEANVNTVTSTDGPYPYVSSDDGNAIAYVKRNPSFATMLLLIPDPKCKGSNTDLQVGAHFVKANEYKVAMKSMCMPQGYRRYWEPGGGEGQLVRIFIGAPEVKLQEIDPMPSVKPLTFTFTAKNFSKEFHKYIRRTMTVY